MYDKIIVEVEGDMVRKKGWIVILIIFLIVFGIEFKGVYEEVFGDFANGTLEEELKEEYANLSVEEKSEYSLEEYIDNNKTTTLTYGVLTCVFSTLFVVIIKYAFLFVVLIGGYAAISKYYDTKLSNIDFDGNIDYYRDILKQYSADILGFIDNVQFIYPNVLVAMILQLKLKGLVRVENNGIYVNDGVNLEDLSSNERYLIGKIKNNKLIMSNVSEYENLVVSDGVSRGVLEKKDINNDFLFRKFAASISIYLIILIGYILYLFWGPSSFSFGIDNVVINMILVFGGAIIVFLIPIFLFFFPFYLKIKISVYSHKMKNNPYFRTKKAEEINNKLEGLKKFLRDFSKLDDRKAKEIILWDEYLIYSVLFGHNSKILDEYKDVIVIYDYQQNGYQQNC